MSGAITAKSLQFILAFEMGFLKNVDLCLYLLQESELPHRKEPWVNIYYREGS